MDARLVQCVRIAGFIEDIRLGLGKMHFDIISGLVRFRSPYLLIDSPNLETETSGGGGELRIVGQQ